MKFTYTKITESCYLEQTDEIEEFGDEFEIEKEYGFCAWQMVDDLDLVEEVAEAYYDELKDIFEQEAMEWYND